jgi:uncharacterized iron-regulated membrane protein
MKAQSQRRLRQLHFWLSLFFAPAIIFFALSGSMQALGFQDRTGAYQPPAWVGLVANVHKHGMLKRPPKPMAQAARPSPPKAAKAAASPNPFLFFMAILGVILAASAGLGIWIAFVNRNGRRTALLLLLAGLSVPVLLLIL